jgi:hypothetical protein
MWETGENRNLRSNRNGTECEMEKGRKGEVETCTGQESEAIDRTVLVSQRAGNDRERQANETGRIHNRVRQRQVS